MRRGSAARVFFSMSCVLLGLTTGCSEGGEKPDVRDDDSSDGGAGATAPNDVTVPFALDDHFFASGWMGAAVDGNVFIDPNGCKPRIEGAQGRCHLFESEGGGAVGWVGLYWLSTANNWGQMPGLSVEAGARRVSFLAASDPPRSVRFLVGGVEGNVPHPDHFKAETTFSLSGELERYEIDMTALDYTTGVQGGFGWVIDGGQPAKLWIDDLRWE